MISHENSDTLTIILQLYICFFITIITTLYNDMMEITVLELLYSIFCMSKWQCMWYYVIRSQNSDVMEIYKHHMSYTQIKIL